ncbi:DUF4294 domain-containing protein [Prevotella sp. KH2C16]|uniref:DUF4294 domain-containing protein n=1 Tax=Prevotella sp. KH2C16 TaxID=1855325 RepID=UPI0008E2ADE1|nr:DUF4294 domain-containing protein [Prevotella sp. KH2C16]SFF85989.1 protein of unknown function [Prevotella sp. KH2C16]
MYKLKTFLTGVFAFLLFQEAEAQNTQPGYINPEDRPVKMDSPSFEPMVKVGKVLNNGDSIQYVELNNIYVYPVPFFKDEAQKARYNRLVYNVKKVLPIAKEVSTVVIETGDYLNTLPNEEARKKHMKYVEKSIIKEYTPRMKKLTYQQGKLLIKLIYRECGSSSYNLIQAFFGPARAGLYQGVAWFFGASLMKQYEPNGIDRLTERVVRQVESGQI